MTGALIWIQILRIRKIHAVEGDQLLPGAKGTGEYGGPGKVCFEGDQMFPGTEGTGECCEP